MSVFGPAAKPQIRLSRIFEQRCVRGETRLASVCLTSAICRFYRVSRIFLTETDTTRRPTRTNPELNALRPGASPSPPEDCHAPTRNPGRSYPEPCCRSPEVSAPHPETSTLLPGALRVAPGTGTQQPGGRLSLPEQSRAATRNDAVAARKRIARTPRRARIEPESDRFYPE